MRERQPPPRPTAAPTLQTCPDCGGILEQTNPPWQAFVHPVHADPPRTPPTDTGRWLCLICGYRKP